MILFVGHSKLLHILICLKALSQFLLGVKMAPRQTETNAYAKFNFWSE